MQSFHRNCSDNSRLMWNGSACVSSAVLCPGGYQWNGVVCVIQQSIIHLRASVPSKCDKKAQTIAPTLANRLSRIEEVTVSSMSRSSEFPTKADSIDSAGIFGELPLPIYTSSPLCSFGYIWDRNECRKIAPICPENYAFAYGKCLRRSFPIHSFANGLNKWRKRSIEPNVEKLEEQNDSCCTIASPRYCRQITTDNWQCFHHKVKGCGNICVKPVIFLRPKRQLWTGNLLVMTPPSQRLASILQGNHIQSDRKIGRYLLQF